mmetsp:Transcript_21853/g.64498  ORF Transcript_21853/g.64498 Transcript_21853/m.64498 type:complete len:242 (+) Transcript_21853:707-1432(+)
MPPPAPFHDTRFFSPAPPRESGTARDCSSASDGSETESESTMASSPRDTHTEETTDGASKVPSSSDQPPYSDSAPPPSGTTMAETQDGNAAAPLRKGGGLFEFGSRRGEASIAGGSGKSGIGCRRGIRGAFFGRARGCLGTITAVVHVTVFPHRPPGGEDYTPELLARPQDRSANHHWRYLDFLSILPCERKTSSLSTAVFHPQHQFMCRLHVLGVHSTQSAAPRHITPFGQHFTKYDVSF